MPSTGNDSGGCARRKRRTSSANRRSGSVNANSIFYWRASAGGARFDCSPRAWGPQSPGRPGGSHYGPATAGGAHYQRRSILRRMRYGFYLPTRGQTATPEALEAIVTRGEALGFASVMIADHLVFPVEIKSRYPYTVSGVFPGQGDALDQLSLMAFVAAKTSRLRLVTSVMIVPYRNPVVTAKALATIDVLSKGRVTVGVGVGWLREEFEALGS